MINSMRCIKKIKTNVKKHSMNAKWFGKTRAFTLVEILVIVAIIGILSVVVLAFLDKSRLNARKNSVATTVRSTLPIIISCKDSGGTVANPAAGNQICDNNYPDSFWPSLPGDYQYQTGGGNIYNSNICLFNVTSAADAATIQCDCYKSMCAIN